MATINFNFEHLINNGHKANPKDELDGYAIDFIKNLIDCATEDFTIHFITTTNYLDDDSTSHVTYTIHTDISAMDNPVLTIADMDLVLGKYIDWETFINLYPSDWEYQIAGFYNWDDQLVIVFTYTL